MSLNLSELKMVKQADDKVTARCPACAEAGHDHTGNHLTVFADGRFACVVNSGPDGQQHRKRIFELVGVKDRATICFQVRKAPLPPEGARRVIQSNILGRLGHHFSPLRNFASNPSGVGDLDKAVKESTKGVPSVPEGPGILNPETPEQKWPQYQSGTADPGISIFRLAYQNLCIRFIEGADYIPELLSLNDRCTKLRLEFLAGRVGINEFQAAVDLWHDGWIQAFGLGINAKMFPPVLPADGVKP